MQENIQVIKELIEGFLGKLCVGFNEISFLKEEGSRGGARFLIKTDEPGILIGSDGANISAINHLIKKIVWKEVNKQVSLTDKLDFFIDVNDYQGKNIERIKSQALDLAEKAVLFKKDIEMPPMSSYERMIVHAVLADNPRISTESIGEKDFRRLVIKSK